MVSAITAGSSAPLLKADNLCVTRNGKLVLDHVSLAIHPGEFTTIIGPNGAGKTMLLHALMGFFAADSGTIERNPHLRIGYVPQRLAADTTLPISVRRFLKLVNNVTNAEIDAILKLTQCHDIADQLLHVLSGGELQRVLLARALLHKPNLLVLDEPAQNLDVSGQLAFYKLLESIYKEQQCSILMVSHDLHMVMASTSKVICLFHHICCSGEPSVVTKDPQFVALFGHDMARMMAVYHHAHSHSHEGHDHAH